jgi:hypothetical protein
MRRAAVHSRSRRSVIPRPAIMKRYSLVTREEQEAILPSIKHSSNDEQRQILFTNWYHIAFLMRLPASDHARRISVATGIVARVLLDIEREEVGPMTLEYLHTLFHYGEEALRMLLEALQARHGGREVDLHLAAPIMAISLEPRLLQAYSARRTSIMTTLHGVAHASKEESYTSRLHACAQILLVGVNSESPVEFTTTEGVTVYCAPLNSEDVSSTFEDELWCYAQSAVKLLGLWLSRRYFHWPVEIKGWALCIAGDEEVHLKQWQYIRANPGEDSSVVHLRFFDGIDLGGETCVVVDHERAGVEVVSKERFAGWVKDGKAAVPCE